MYIEQEHQRIPINICYLKVKKSRIIFILMCIQICLCSSSPIYSKLPSPKDEPKEDDLVSVFLKIVAFHATRSPGRYSFFAFYVNRLSSRDYCSY
jgi:hypothetical protein